MNDSDPDWRLVTLLSASSYPVPASAGKEIPESEVLAARSASYGGYKVASVTNAYTDDAVVPSSRSGTKKHATPKKSGKAGRPLLPDVDSSATTAKERRQMQLRRAQRAYRQRKESSMSALQDHATKLQNTIKEMGDQVFAINDTLIDAGLLTKETEMAAQLREMTQKCLDLAKEAEDKTTLVSSDLPSQKGATSPSTDSSAEEVVIIDTHQRTKFLNFYPSRPLSGPPMSYAQFTKQFELVGLQQAYMVLSNPNIPSRKLKRTFIFLWGLMDRECMTLYYEAALNATLANKRIEYSDEVPFFRLGGAGSHYQNNSSSSMRLYPYRNDGKNIISDPLSRLPLDMQDQFDGPWFDMIDLEGYLEQNHIQLRITPPSASDMKSTNSMHVNVTKFMTALLQRSICLGRSPGFQFREVQKALNAAMWT